MVEPKRKFIEGHSYVEIHRFTRALSFWELEESYKAMKKYRSENHDKNIPVCIRLKKGDIRVKKYDEQIGLDPKTYYGNASDIAFVTYGAYDSRKAMNKRFLQGEIRQYPKADVKKANSIELLNLKDFLEDVKDEWVYVDKDRTEDGKTFYILETIDPEIIRTIYKDSLTATKAKNDFLLKYGNENSANIERERVINLVNHFRPAKNVLKEVKEAIDEL